MIFFLITNELIVLVSILGRAIAGGKNTLILIFKKEKKIVLKFLNEIYMFSFETYIVMKDYLFHIHPAPKPLMYS